MKNFKNGLIDFLVGYIPLALITIILLLGIRAFNTFWVAKVYLTSGGEAHALANMEADDLKTNLWIKAELDMIVDHYMETAAISEYNGTTIRQAKKYNYFIPILGSDGSIFYLTVYASPDQKEEFNNVCREFHNWNPGQGRGQTISFEARVKSLPDNERALFKQFLVTEYNHAETEAEAIILPYALSETEMEGELPGFIITITVFTIALILLLFSYVVRKKLQKKKENKPKDHLTNYINDFQ